jgi:hypothetical protein
MKAEVTGSNKENVGGVTPGKRLVVTCGPTEDDTTLRSMSFSVPFTPENATKYATGNIIDVGV